MWIYYRNNFIGLTYSDQLINAGKDLAEAISFVPELNIKQNYPKFDEKLKKIFNAEKAAWQDPQGLPNDAAWAGEASQSGAGKGTGQNILNAIEDCKKYLETLQEQFVLGPAARGKKIEELSDDLEHFKNAIAYILPADGIEKWLPLVKDALKKRYGQSESSVDTSGNTALYNLAFMLKNMA